MDNIYTAWRKLSATSPRPLNNAVPSPVTHKRRQDILSIYRRWWLGKRVRAAIDPTAPFRLVVGVKWFGPPSGVYGTVELTFDGGEKRMVQTTAYRPRKKDIEVDN